MTRHARPTRRTAGLRRWGRALLLFVLLLPLVPVGAMALARADAATLDEAVSQAVRAAPGRRRSGAVHVVEAIGRGGWSFGTAAPQETGGGEAPPEVVYYLARQSAGRWAATVESSSAFGTWARQAPAGVVPAVFLPGSSDQVSAQATKWWSGRTSLPLAFPFPIGSTWRLVAGPHGHNQADATQHPWAALDFNPDLAGATSGEVVAAAPGFATTPCAVGEDLGPLVKIRHEQGGETEYFHLANVPPSASGNIARGARLGETSTRTTGGSCFGSASVKHLHFAVQRVQNGKTTKSELNGVPIGGYRIVQGKKAYQGCLVRSGAGNPVVVEQCAVAPIENTGELGAGSYFAGANKALVSMKRATVSLKRFPPEESFAVSILYSPYGGSPSATRDLGTIRTTRDGSADLKITVPLALGSGTAHLCAKGNEDNLYHCAKTRIVSRHRQPF